MSYVENKLGSYVELCDDPTPSPAGIIIFGASGDLTFRKLIPSIFQLFKKRKLVNFYLLGVGRSNINDEEYRKKAYNRLLEDFKDKKLINMFVSHLYFLSGNYNSEELYNNLKKDYHI
nr:hypothetical protein [Marinitoga lauensis]